MFRFLLAPFLALAAFFHPHAYNSVIERAQSSVVRVTGYEKLDPIMQFFTGQTEAEYVCSGEVIGPDTILTANHCIGEKMLADGVKAFEVKADSYYDLALIHASTKKPSIHLRDEPLQRFEPLTGIGYADGYTRLTPLNVRAMLIDYTEDYKKLPPQVFVHPTYIGGMSGGPVIDTDGLMVGIIQRGEAGSMGSGVGAQIIKAFLLGTELN